MPVNQSYSLSKLVEALHVYRRRTGERITIEYALIDGVNDDPQLAYEMAALLDGLEPYINGRSWPSRDTRTDGFARCTSSGIA